MVSAEGFLFMEESPSVSQLLTAWGRGEPAALEQLNPRVYGELHKLARAYLRRGSSGQRVKTTKPNSVCYAKSPDG